MSLGLLFSCELQGFLCHLQALYSPQGPQAHLSIHKEHYYDCFNRNTHFLLGGTEAKGSIQGEFWIPPALDSQGWGDLPAQLYALS